MKVGEKKLTKGVTGSGGSGGAYSSKGSFLKAIGRKFGFGKRTSKQTKAEAAWKQSLGEKKPIKKSKEVEARSLDKKEMEKAKEINEAKKLKKEQEYAVAKQRKADQLADDKKRVKGTVRRVVKNIVAPALLASAYEVSGRKKKK